MLLPADIEPRAVLGSDALSHSELSTLARCEQAWCFSYTGEREHSAPSRAMALGTELHRLWGAWWQTSIVPASDDPAADLIFARYARHYGADWGGRVRCVGVEMPVAARFSWGPWFFGFVDGLFHVQGVEDVPDGLYVGEAKSSDQLSAATHLVESAQTPLYVWALRQMGYPVLGAFVDVIRTSGHEPKLETKDDCYRRLRRELVEQGRKEAAAETRERVASERQLLGEPALAETFDRRWLLDADLDIPRALGQARRASAVRRQLLDGEPPLRAVGWSCGTCFHQAPCFGLDVLIEDE